MELRTQVVLVAVVVGAACAASKPPDGKPAQPAADALRPADAGMPRPRVDAGPKPPRVDAGPPRAPDAGTPDAGTPDAGAPDGGPPKPKGTNTTPLARDSAACPSGMILVDGDYCTEV